MSNTGCQTIPVYFGAEKSVFGFAHEPSMYRSDTAVVLCNTIGFEQVRIHRTVRQLAHDLCSNGIPVLRFDFRSTGDSLGESDSVDAWLTDLYDAVELSKKLFQVSNTAAVGIRMGGTLLAKAAEAVPFSHIVLWEALSTGKLFEREMRFVAEASKLDSRQDLSGAQTTVERMGLDAGGIYLPQKARDEIKQLEAGNESFCGSPAVLFVEQTDINANTKLRKAVSKFDQNVCVAEAPDHNMMMLPPERANVPVTAIKNIVDWLHERLINSDRGQPNRADKTPLDMSISAKRTVNGSFDESAFFFGQDNRLFGTIAQPTHNASAGKKPVLLATGGSIPRFAANRMYTTIARNLATHGHTVMRFDVSGVGDSHPGTDWPTKSPYSTLVTEDMGSALEKLREQSQRSDVCVLGLCSGAFAAFEAGRRDDNIDHLILINQLIYYLSDQEFSDLKLGKISSAQALDYPRNWSLVNRIVRKLLNIGYPHIAGIGEILSTYLVGGNLPRDLDILCQEGKRISFIFSKGDSANEALKLSAGRTVARLVNEGKADIHVVQGADHTFSSIHSKEAVIKLISKLLGAPS